jgi:flagellar hook-associated protein 1 FlgK
VGSLKSTLLARGDHRATYQELNDINPDGEYEEGWYDTNISQSIIMNVESEFDQLIHNVTTKINDILAEAAERESNTNEGSSYLRDEDGNPYRLFEMQNEEAGMTVSNLLINTKLRQDPTLLGFRLGDHSEDNETMEALKSAFEETIYTLNPNVQTPVNFVDYYKNLVAQVANSGSVFRAIQDSQTTTTDALEAAREQIVGVSSDEELTNMIMYQNAYNASSRYINVVDEMLEHILNTLGR